MAKRSRFFKVSAVAFFSLFFLFLVGCSVESKSATQQAVVLDNINQVDTAHNFYVVQKDDSLVSIALSLGLDVKKLVKINHLSPPYEVKSGQRIRLFNGSNAEANKFLANRKIKKWMWPVTGRNVVQQFSKKGIVPNNGIDIAGRAGDSVVATAFGKVVYCGSGLSSYGKMIIIKHNDRFLSTYALNKNIFVSEGQFVKAGERIAEMGENSAGKAILHFEIRYNGKPVNPMHFLTHDNKYIR